MVSGLHALLPGSISCVVQLGCAPADKGCGYTARGRRSLRGIDSNRTSPNVLAEHWCLYAWVVGIVSA